MRKLNKIEKNMKTSIEGITNSTCQCIVICKGDTETEKRINYHGIYYIQRDSAYTGNVPQGVNIDI